MYLYCSISALGTNMDVPPENPIWRLKECTNASGAAYTGRLKQLISWKMCCKTPLEHGDLEWESTALKTCPFLFIRFNKTFPDDHCGIKPETDIPVTSMWEIYPEFPKSGKSTRGVLLCSLKAVTGDNDFFVIFVLNIF